MKTHELILRKFCPKFKKWRNFMARYCDKSNGSFETRPQVFHGTQDDNRGNIAG